jgi:hypothetical protein
MGSMARRAGGFENRDSVALTIIRMGLPFRHDFSRWMGKVDRW